MKLFTIILMTLLFVSYSSSGDPIFEIWDFTNIDDAKLIGWWNPWECQSLSNV